METLGLDMTDDSLKDSPKRVAKMYVNEIFGGLLPENKPGISTFSNKYKYRQMLVEKDITVILSVNITFANYRKSACCLHFERRSNRSFKN
jgi:GTP cyclohydrolase I